MVNKIKGGDLWVVGVKLVPNNIAVCFVHKDSFELDHFDQSFQIIFLPKVKYGTVFEAIVLGYDRYTPTRLGVISNM